jgi:hypothetical protein
MDTVTRLSDSASYFKMFDFLLFLFVTKTSHLSLNIYEKEFNWTEISEC